jgi:hypothetical protein
MLGFTTRYGASKGMVAVPSLSGLTSEAAEALIAQRGLRLQSKASRNSSSQNNRVSSQTVAPGTLVDYETDISFIFDVLVADQISFGNCESYYSEDSGSWCTGTYTNNSQRTTYFRRLRTVTSVDKPTTTEWIYDCGSSTSAASGGYVDGSCGYTTPVVSCTADTKVHIAWGSCVNGIQKRTMYKITAKCVESYPVEERCCQTSKTVVYGNWIRDTHSRVRTVTTTDTLCNVTETTETVCTTRTTTPICGACTKKSPFRRSCTSTTINSDCTTKKNSYSENC